MKLFQSRPVFWASTALVSLWTLAFSMACRLSQTEYAMSATSDSAFVKVFGDARLAISENMYMRADVFFHKGVPHYRQKAFEDPLQHLAETIAPRGHKHIHGKDLKEIMPWLFLSIKADPNNALSYTVAAFWLAKECNRPDLAEEVLREGRRNAPRDYRLCLAQGRLYLKLDEPEKAARSFDTGLRLWPRGEDDARQAKLDLAELLTYRGLIYESEGQKSKALAAYRQVLSFLPKREGLRRRSAALEEDRVTESSPEDYWGSMLDQFRHVCQREEHDHDHHDQHHHDHHDHEAEATHTH